MRELRLLLLSALLMTATAQAEPVRTSMDVEAQVGSTLRLYVAGTDVTGGTISLKLEPNADNKLEGTSPPIQFVGNIGMVSMSLSGPDGLVSENNVKMLVEPSWIRMRDGVRVSARMSYYLLKVYPTWQDIPDKSKGPKVSFLSEKPFAAYPIGTYHGTYVIFVRADL